MSGEGRERRLADRCLGALPAWLRTARGLSIVLLAVGLALRAFVYLRNPSVWQDEAALLVNVIGKGFAELLGPLTFSEAAPPLFLWAERAVVLMLGESTYATRLLPFLASCAALLLIVPVARALLRPAAVPWAVLLFGVNDHLLWHASEAKPYSLDVLAATVLLLVWVRTRDGGLGRRLLLYAALAPVVIWISYPGCFLYGGLMLALLPALWRERARPAAWLGYGTLAVAVGLSFGMMYLGPVRAQHNAEITACWTQGFPPWDRGWWAVPAWAVKSTLDMMCYCNVPAGNALVVLLALGCGVLWRRGERSLLLLLAAPAGLALLAAFAGSYPYTGARVLVYMTPAVILLTAAGVPPALEWLAARARPAAAALVVLLLAGVPTVARNVSYPYGRPDNGSASRWVLADYRPGDVVTGNSMEHDYYFRSLGTAYVHGRLEPDASARRLWVVVVAVERQNRDALWPALAPDGWQLRERRDFYRATVLLLEPPADGLAARAAHE